MKDLKLQIPNLSRDEAKERIAKVCNVKKISLEFLGEGYEGFVFTDKKFVYKIFKPSPRQDKLYFNLSALSHTLEKLEFKFHYPFKVVYNNSDLIIYYKYLKSSNLHNANKEQFQNFLNEYYFANIVHLDLKPKNLCIDYLGTSILLVSHNIGVIRAMADEILVLHQGKTVDYGKKDDILAQPTSEYTEKLLEAVPRFRR